MATTKIVVLDGYTLNPGDLTWDDLRGLGTCEIHDRTSPDEVIPRAAGAQILLTNKTVLDGRVLAQLPNLKYIGVLATGYNVVDTQAARRRNIPVTNIPTYGTQSVAQMTFAHVLELTQRVGHHAQSVREGRWSTAPDWCYWDHPLIELEGLIFGIIGFGRIGQAVARLANAFGMSVLAHDAMPPRQLPPYVKMADLDTLLRQSDVISLHCPLTADNKGLINAQRLARMKRTALLINTSRGPLINEADVAHALNTGQIAGAGLDVLAAEPPRPDNPLLCARNCHLTPHIAWATRAARGRLMKIAVDNVRAFLDDRPVNVIN